MRCGSRVIAYALRLSRRAQHPSLTIRPETGLVAVVPPGCPHEELESLMRRHARWILRQTDRFAAAAARIPRRWPYGPTLPYQGIEHTVVLRMGRVPLVRRSDDGRLVVQLRPSAPASALGGPGSEAPPPRLGGMGRVEGSSLERARRLLKRWYIEEAFRHLEARANVWAEALHVTWRRLRVKDQRCRWGSCSLSGNVNFNYRLIMAPPRVLEYVVLHELLHRRELNHSARFWRLVAHYCPVYRDLVRWLNTYGSSLGV